MSLPDLDLTHALRLAYSAERAAALAYRGHAKSLRDPAEQAAVRRIEQDEWHHRDCVRQIMGRHGVPVSRGLELRYLLIGRVIGLSCFVIGRFMPYFFAGKLESGNVCAYLVMIRQFHALGITEHDAMLHEMGLKEKEHEVHFLTIIRHERWLPRFERLFAWGPATSLNDLDPDHLPTVADATHFCPRTGADADQR